MRHEGVPPSNNLIKDGTHRATVFVGPTLKSSPSLLFFLTKEVRLVPAAQATSNMIGEVIDVSNKGIDAWKDWVDEKTYYDELSLKDQLAGWENLQKQYKAGSEERKEIDREVYRLQNELVASTYQASIDWIEEEKYYNRLSTEEELAAYERMQSRYMEGSEERMEIDRKVYTLRNQLVDESYEKTMELLNALVENYGGHLRVRKVDGVR